jgi:hypothetical protein
MKGGWLVLAGIGLLLLGILVYRPYSRQRKGGMLSLLACWAAGLRVFGIWTLLSGRRKGVKDM